MIVWSGRGILSVLVLIASIIIFVSMLPRDQGNYGIVAGFLFTGAFSWHMGKKWNDPDGRSTIDPETGREVIYEPEHTLYWIPMEYWGVVFGIVGVILFVIRLL